MFVLVLLVDIHVGGLTGAAGTRAGVAAMIVSSCLSCGALVVIVVALVAIVAGVVYGVATVIML